MEDRMKVSSICYLPYRGFEQKAQPVNDERCCDHRRGFSAGRKKEMIEAASP
jgi:hypothetical protein